MVAIELETQNTSPLWGVETGGPAKGVHNSLACIIHVPLYMFVHRKTAFLLFHGGYGPVFILFWKKWFIDVFLLYFSNLMNVNENKILKYTIITRK